MGGLFFLLNFPWNKFHSYNIGRFNFHGINSNILYSWNKYHGTLSHKSME